jgi:hypothetical protein
MNSGTREISCRFFFTNANIRDTLYVSIQKNLSEFSQGFPLLLKQMVLFLRTETDGDAFD